VKTCEFDLDKFDVVVRHENHVIYVGPRNNASSLPVSLSAGTVISWVDEMRYLEIFIMRSRIMLIGTRQKSVYRAANAIFAKIGRVASLEVTLQLIKSKCLPVLLYGLEACFLTMSDLQSLDFVINGFFIRLFATKSILKLSSIVKSTLAFLYRVY